MKNKELLTALAERTGFSAKQTEELLQATTASMIEQLTSDKTIVIQNFGTLEVRKKNERVSVHPVSGVRTLIPPKLALNFKQNQTLKDRLKDVQL